MHMAINKEACLPAAADALAAPVPADAAAAAACMIGVLSDDLQKALRG